MPNYYTPLTNTKYADLIESVSTWVRVRYMYKKSVLRLLFEKIKKKLLSQITKRHWPIQNMQFLLSQSVPESEKCPLAHPPAAPHLLQLLLPSAWTNCKRLLADFRWNYWRIFRASLWFRPIHYKAGMVRHWKSTLLLGIQVDLNLSFDGGLKLCFFGGGGERGLILSTFFCTFSIFSDSEIPILKAIQL